MESTRSRPFPWKIFWTLRKTEEPRQDFLLDAAVGFMARRHLRKSGADAAPVWTSNRRPLPAHSIFARPEVQRRPSLPGAILTQPAPQTESRSALILWVLRKIARQQTPQPSALIFWIANGIVAVLFVLEHLPSAKLSCRLRRFCYWRFSLPTASSRWSAGTFAGSAVLRQPCSRAFQPPSACM